MPRTSLSFILIIGGLLLLGWLGKIVFETKFGLGNLPEAVYEPTVWGRSVVSAMDGLPTVTRVKLTPDEWTMFATTLDGRLWVMNNVDNAGRYVRQEAPIYAVNTGWTQGSENGMTGLAVSY